MANRTFADVEASGRDGTVYRFRLGAGALCVLEETSNLNAKGLYESLQAGEIRASVLREYVKAASVDNGALGNDEAVYVIDNVGIMPLVSALSESLLLTYNIPKKNDVESAAAAVEPAKRRRGRPVGTGILKPVAS